MAPRSRHRRASSGPPVKQWKTVRSGVPSARRMSNVSSQASRVWMISGRRRSWASWIWAANAVLLGVAGRVVVVVVEPGLADGDDARRVEEIDDRVDAVRRLVRVQSDRGVDVVESRRHLDRRQRRGAVASDRHHRLHAGGARRGDRAVRAVGDPLVVDVAVRIEPFQLGRHHRAPTRPPTTGPQAFVADTTTFCGRSGCRKSGAGDLWQTKRRPAVEVSAANRWTGLVHRTASDGAKVTAIRPSGGGRGRHPW